MRSDISSRKNGLVKTLFSLIVNESSSGDNFLSSNQINDNASIVISKFLSRLEINMNHETPNLPYYHNCTWRMMHNLTRHTSYYQLLKLPHSSTSHDYKVKILFFTIVQNNWSRISLKKNCFDSYTFLMSNI